MKVDKVLKIIILCLLVALGIGVLVMYLIDPNYVKGGFNYIVELCNKPLPIIGITTSAVLIFIWRLVVSTNYGKKKLAEYDKKVADIEKAKNDYEQQASETLKEYKNEIDLLRTQLASVCELSTNKKVNEYGKGLCYGETTYNTTKGE